MLTANHSAMGFLSKVFSERKRILRIHSGSPFHQEICSTTRSLRPFSGVKAYSTSSLQPKEYLERSRSKLVMGNFSYADSNNYRVQPHRRDLWRTAHRHLRRGPF